MFFFYTNGYWTKQFASPIDSLFPFIFCNVCTLYIFNVCGIDTNNSCCCVGERSDRDEPQYAGQAARGPRAQGHGARD